jgi:hypothetical protein
MAQFNWGTPLLQYSPVVEQLSFVQFRPCET